MTSHICNSSFTSSSYLSIIIHMFMHVNYILWIKLAYAQMENARKLLKVLSTQTSTVASHLNTRLEPGRIVRTQPVGAHFRVQGFPNFLCYGIARRCVLQGLGFPKLLVFRYSWQVRTLGFRVSQIACVLLQCRKNQMESVSIQKTQLYSRVLTLCMSCISRFSTSRINCYALSSNISRGTFDDLKNCLNHFRARYERSASKPNTKTSKLTPNDDSRHVQLINLEP